MTSEYSTLIQELRRTQNRIRVVREQTCEPKANSDPRYLAFSNAVSNLNRAIADLEIEMDR